MTVAELIERLKEHPQEMRVAVVRTVRRLVLWHFITPGFRFRWRGRQYLRQWPWYRVYSLNWYCWNSGKWSRTFREARARPASGASGSESP